MSVGDYHPPLTDSGYNPLLPVGVSIPWQPPQGWDIYVGDPPPNRMPTIWPSPWTDVPQIYPEAPSKRIPDNCFITTTTSTNPSATDVSDARIAALEAEVKRLGRECKRLRRKLAQRRRP